MISGHRGEQNLRVAVPVVRDHEPPSMTRDWDRDSAYQIDASIK